MGDRHVYGSRTRFITNSMTGLFESMPKAPPLPPLRNAGVAAAPQVDIAARLRKLF
jgi:DNA helicase-2/ATP-dependent DNA helicase PcrA